MSHSIRMMNDQYLRPFEQRKYVMFKIAIDMFDKKNMHAKCLPHRFLHLVDSFCCVSARCFSEMKPIFVFPFCWNFFSVNWFIYLSNNSIQWHRCIKCTFQQWTPWNGGNFTTTVYKQSSFNDISTIYIIDNRCFWFDIIAFYVIFKYFLVIFQKCCFGLVKLLKNHRNNGKWLMNIFYVDFLQKKINFSFIFFHCFWIS